MPIYVDESGGLSAGAMTMAAVDISQDNAERLLHRFRTITGLRGELKGSRIDLIERGLFFELLDRFEGRAQVRIVRTDLLGTANRHSDFDIYVALLKQLVEDWLPESHGDTNFVVDEGRYSDLVLEQVRLDIAHMLDKIGTARLVDSARCAGVQIADVIANSYYNLAIHSGRAHRIAGIVEPFVQTGLLRSKPLTNLDGPDSKNPAMLGNAGL